MSLFIEVQSLEKKCPVIINLDEVVEIAPLIEGGCALFTISNGIIKVSDTYDQFKQFAMQQVSTDDVTQSIARLSKVEKEPAPVADILAPSKNAKGKGIVDDLKIPKL